MVETPELFFLELFARNAGPGGEFDAAAAGGTPAGDAAPGAD
jgi:hypothetical protein